MIAIFLMNGSIFIVVFAVDLDWNRKIWMVFNHSFLNTFLYDEGAHNQLANVRKVLQNRLIPAALRATTPITPATVNVLNTTGSSG